MAHEHNAPAEVPAPAAAAEETQAKDAEGASQAKAPREREASGKGRGKDRDRGRGRDQDKPRKGRGKDRGKGDKDRGRGKDRRASSPLKAGLFASVADKQMPCRVEGCTRTWSWSGVDQMRSLGQEPPQRMCDEHLGELNQLEDREIECRNPGCSNTWTWKRGAQLHQLQKQEKQEKLRPPSRLCASCFEAERSLADAEVECRVPGCKHTWTWTKDAQQKHRAWLRRLQAKQQAEEAEPTPERKGQAAAEPGQGPAAESPEPAPGAPAEGEGAETTARAEAPAEGQGKKKRRKKNRKKKKKLPEGPPEKMCGRCAGQLAKFEPQEQPCKVHGCTRTWTWSKEHQLRAWVALGTDDPEAKPVAPKRMCITCRDFCRARPDREVACGRPGCGNTWTWKTGAQLQAHLAGKTQEPIRLCDTCAKGEFLLARSGTDGLPPGAEIMPCVVPACEGTWTYLPGMQLTGASEGDLPVDRMCDSCRGERDLPPRSLPVTEPKPEPTTEAPDRADGGEENSVEGNSVEGNSVEGNSVEGNSGEENSEAASPPSTEAKAPEAAERVDGSVESTDEAASASTGEVEHEPEA